MNWTDDFYKNIFCSSLPYYSSEWLACNSIKNRLKKYGIDCSVSRHVLFGEKIYLIGLHDDCELSVNQYDIAKALNIPDDWVDLYSSVGYPVRYAIREDEFNDKYMVDDEIVFDFNLLDILKNDNARDVIVDHIDCLNDVDDVCIYGYDLILIKNADYSALTIAQQLNIPFDAIIDVSSECNDVTHIIIGDRLNGDSLC